MSMPKFHVNKQSQYSMKSLLYGYKNHEVNKSSKPFFVVETQVHVPSFNVSASKKHANRFFSSKCLSIIRMNELQMHKLQIVSCCMFTWIFLWETGKKGSENLVGMSLFILTFSSCKFRSLQIFDKVFLSYPPVLYIKMNNYPRKMLGIISYIKYIYIYIKYTLACTCLYTYHQIHVYTHFQITWYFEALSKTSI